MNDANSTQLTADLAGLLEVCRATVHQVDELLDRSNFLINSLTDEHLYLTGSKDHILYCAKPLSGQPLLTSTIPQDNRH